MPLWMGTAKCWGNNEDGQLGNGSSTNSSTPVQVTGLVSDVLAISAGKEHTCAVLNGAAKCWGNNQEGRLGDNTVTTLTNLGIIDPNNNNNRMMPVQVMGLVSDVTVISAGDSHTCAIHNGAAKCWGNNEDGRLGDSTTSSIVSGGVTAADNNRKVPKQVMGLVSDVTAISAGGIHTCAIHNGAAKCWGKNNLGQLGNNSKTSSNVPVAVVQTPVDGMTAAVLLDSGVTAISAKTEHTCAVHEGVAKCWGEKRQWTAGYRQQKLIALFLWMSQGWTAESLPSQQGLFTLVPFMMTPPSAGEVTAMDSWGLASLQMVLMLTTCLIPQP